MAVGKYEVLFELGWSIFREKKNFWMIKKKKIWQKD